MSRPGLTVPNVMVAAARTGYTGDGSGVGIDSHWARRSRGCARTGANGASRGCGWTQSTPLPPIPNIAVEHEV